MSNKSLKIYVLLTFTITLFMCVLQTCAQENWASWSHTLEANTYKGLNFRYSAKVKATVDDDSAAARLWARVDKKNGTAFFDNMWQRPVRSSSWNIYKVEGKVDSAASNIVFGALVFMNGQFSYDDMKLEIERKPGKWETVFSDDFESGIDGWQAGINKFNTVGVNPLFTAAWEKEPGGNNKLFRIEGKNVPNYGNNKKAGKYAAVNGIQLYYEIYGEGKPLVVLHGNGGSIENATPHYPDLIKQYKVIAVDSRAQGKSTDTGEPLTYEQMAADVNALLEQLKIDSAFIWGQSDGAILCLILAKDYPKKVKRVVAYAPNVQPDSMAVYGWAIDALHRTISKSKDPREIKLNQLMLNHPNITYEELRKISAPCLIMGGDRDVIRGEHLLKMFQSIPNAHLCILPGATHGGAWEQKDRFMQIMNDFFNQPFSMPDTKSWFAE